jgi:hypothetical protein
VSGDWWCVDATTRVPVLLMSEYPDANIEILEAPAEILVADAFLANMDAHPSYSYGDGILTVHARNGDLSYGLHHYDSLRRVWRGTRSDRPRLLEATP